MARKGKTADKKFGHCMECKHAHLLQFGEDPVLAECSLKEDYPRQVARYGGCEEWTASPTEKSIDKKVKTLWFEKL